MATVSRPIATYAKSLKDVAHANTATVVDASVTAAASSVADIGSALVQAHAAQLKDWQDKAADPQVTQPQKEEAEQGKSPSCKSHLLTKASSKRAPTLLGSGGWFHGLQANTLHMFNFKVAVLQGRQAPIDTKENSPGA